MDQTERKELRKIQRRLRRILSRDKKRNGMFRSIPKMEPFIYARRYPAEETEWPVIEGMAAVRKRYCSEIADESLKLNDFAKKVHEVAKAHGWYDGPGHTFPEMAALFHSEISEAVEEDRRGMPGIYCAGCRKHCGPDMLVQGGIPISLCEAETNDLVHVKTAGVAIELADCIIRILDACAYMEIDIERAIMLKYAYNKSREYRHGGKRY